MKKDTQETTTRKFPTKNRLSRAQLAMLDSELETFREIFVTKDGQEKTYINQLNWFIARNAKNDNETIINLEVYEQCLEDWYQWLEWKGKKEYAIKMAHQSYDQQ